MLYLRKNLKTMEIQLSIEEALQAIQTLRKSDDIWDHEIAAVVQDQAIKNLELEIEEAKYEMLMLGLSIDRTPEQLQEQLKWFNNQLTK